MIISKNKKIRAIREQKSEEIVHLYETSLAREKERERIFADYYKKARSVVDFFYANCPFDISDDDVARIQKTFFNGKSTKSVLGIINYLQGIVGENWLEWTTLAKKEFNINY